MSSSYKCDATLLTICSGGTGRTGTFIAVSILLERLKTEGVVDVFHTVRALRLQRPSMVQTVVSINSKPLILHTSLAHVLISKVMSCIQGGGGGGVH